MYNQGNRGPRPRMPMLSAYHHRPQALPPHHYQQGTPALPPPPPFVQQVSNLRQPSNGVPPPALPPPQMIRQVSPFQVPDGMRQTVGRPYAAASSLAHGSGGLYRNAPQNFGVQGHVPVPPQSHLPHPEMLKASTQRHHQFPPPLGGTESIQYAPSLPLSTSGFLVPPPPLPPLPPPPPPSLQFSNLRSSQLSVSESKSGGEDTNLNGGSAIECFSGDRILSTSCLNSDVQSPPSNPTEGRTLPKIEALGKLTPPDGPDTGNRALQNGLEKHDPLLTHKTVDSSENLDNAKASSGADSDMEMEG